MATKYCPQLTSPSVSVPTPSPFLHSQISPHCLYSLSLFPSPYSPLWNSCCVNYINETAPCKVSSDCIFQILRFCRHSLSSLIFLSSIRPYWPHCHSNILTAPLCVIVFPNSSSWSFNIRGPWGSLWSPFMVILLISMIWPAIYTLLTTFITLVQTLSLGSRLFVCNCLLNTPH